MAIGGVMLSGVLLIAIGGLFILSAISLGIFFISIIAALTDRKEKSGRTVSLLFGMLSVVLIVPLVLLIIYSSNNVNEIIKFAEKEYSTDETIVDTFLAKIDDGNIDELEKALDENPNLINSEDSEGLLPLGRAIKNKNLDSVKYFMRKEVDINKVSRNEQIGTLEFMLYYNYYDEAVIEYLLTQADLDVNKKHLATPVAQLYVKNICVDNKISDKEIEIFKIMIDKGLDLKATNGANTDTYEFVKDNLKNNVENVKELRDLIDDTNE